MATLALAAVPGTARRAVPLLALVGSGVDIVSWHQVGRQRSSRSTDPSAGARVDAVLAATVDVLAELDGLDVPTAVWVESPGDVRRASAHGVEVPLTSRAELVDHGAVLVPTRGVDVSRYPVMPPLVRARARIALGLPERLVVAVDRAATGTDATTTLALAAAAVVTGPMLPLALALGTPVVTSAHAAARIGLRAGIEAEVAEAPGDADRLAAEVARDDAHAALLSRRARRFAEHHLDLGRPASVVRERLGLVPPNRSLAPEVRLDGRLAELATPATARIRRRAATATAPLSRPTEIPT